MTCGGGDLNPHSLSATGPSNLRVYLFHHHRKNRCHNLSHLLQSVHKFKEFEGFQKRSENSGLSNLTMPIQFNKMFIFRLVKARNKFTISVGRHMIGRDFHVTTSAI